MSVMGWRDGGTGGALATVAEQTALPAAVASVAGRPR